MERSGGNKPGQDSLLKIEEKVYFFVQVLPIEICRDLIKIYVRRIGVLMGDRNPVRGQE